MSEPSNEKPATTASIEVKIKSALKEKDENEDEESNYEDDIGDFKETFSNILGSPQLLLYVFTSLGIAPIEVEFSILIISSLSSKN